jgi:hypothetical protein
MRDDDIDLLVGKERESLQRAREPEQTDPPILASPRLFEATTATPAGGVILNVASTSALVLGGSNTVPLMRASMTGNVRVVGAAPVIALDVPEYVNGTFTGNVDCAPMTSVVGAFPTNTMGMQMLPDAWSSPDTPVRLPLRCRPPQRTTVEG